MPSPSWRSNGIIPEQASTPPEQPPCLAHVEDPNLREGKEARAAITPSQHPQGSLQMSWAHIHPRTEQQSGLGLGLGLGSFSQGKWLGDTEGSAGARHGSIQGFLGSSRSEGQPCMATDSALPNATLQENYTSEVHSSHLPSWDTRYIIIDSIYNLNIFCSIFMLRECLCVHVLYTHSTSGRHRAQQPRSGIVWDHPNLHHKCNVQWSNEGDEFV